MYKQNNICKLAAVLASRFSIHERGVVVREVINVRIYSEPPPCLQCEFQTPCTNLEHAFLPNASHPHVSVLTYTVYNFLQFYFISFQNKLYGCLLERIWYSWVTYNLKQPLQ